MPLSTVMRSASVELFATTFCLVEDAYAATLPVVITPMWDFISLFTAKEPSIYHSRILIHRLLESEVGRVCPVGIVPSSNRLQPCEEAKNKSC